MTTIKWISLEGDLRPPKEMTPRELLEFLEANGFEFLGNASYSEITDEAYAAENEADK